MAVSNDNTPDERRGDDPRDPTLPAELFPMPKPGAKGVIVNRAAYTPPAPTEHNLTKTDHAQWLLEFAGYMGMATAVPMTDFRRGAITRLTWAAQYITYLKNKVETLEHTSQGSAPLAARAEALEEAAQIAAEMAEKSYNIHWCGALRKAAERIRALIEKEPT